MVYHSIASNDYLFYLIVRGKQKKLRQPNSKFLLTFNGRSKHNNAKAPRWFAVSVLFAIIDTSIFQSKFHNFCKIFIRILAVAKWSLKKFSEAGSIE